MRTAPDPAAKGAHDAFPDHLVVWRDCV